MFQERLTSEFAARQQSNPRYSLRAFAAFLGADHSTISQVLKGGRRATVKQIRAWGKKLGISAEEITVHLAAEHVPDAATAERQSQLRHWTAEAMAVVRGPAHWQIVRLSREPGFLADCRWLAAQARVTVDEVNLALTRLLRLGLIDGNWRDRTGIAQFDRAGIPQVGPGARARKGGGSSHQIRKVEGVNQMGNAVMQFQMISKAPEETARFYAALFGWKVDADNPMGYRRIDTGAADGIQGGIWPAPPQAPNFVQLFMLVDDVRAAVERATGLGARLLIPPAKLPEGDEMAVLHDPQGMSFGLWHRAG